MTVLLAAEDARFLMRRYLGLGSASDISWSRVDEFRFSSTVKDEVKSWVGRQMYMISMISKREKEKDQPFFFDPILNRWDSFPSLYE